MLNGFLLLGMDQRVFGLVGVAFAATMFAFVLTGRFKRFSLRALLIGVTVLSILFGILAILKQI
jgi:hypothetical protein